MMSLFQITISSIINAILISAILQYYYYIKYLELKVDTGSKLFDSITTLISAINEDTKNAENLFQVNSNSNKSKFNYKKINLKPYIISCSPKLSSCYSQVSNLTRKKINQQKIARNSNILNIYSATKLVGATNSLTSTTDSRFCLSSKPNIKIKTGDKLILVDRNNKNLADVFVASKVQQNCIEYSWIYNQNNSLKNSYPKFSNLYKIYNVSYYLAKNRFNFYQLYREEWGENGVAIATGITKFIPIIKKYLHKLAITLDIKFQTPRLNKLQQTKFNLTTNIDV